MDGFVQLSVFLISPQHPCLKIVDELNLPAMRLYHLSVVDFSAIREVVSFHPRVRLAEAGERIQI